MATVANELRWENPPATRRVNVQHQLTMLSLQPPEKWGEWARINTYKAGTVAKSVAQNLRGGARTIPAGQWEFASGKLDGEPGYGVWARYLGPDGEAS